MKWIGVNNKWLFVLAISQWLGLIAIGSGIMIINKSWISYLVLFGIGMVIYIMCGILDTKIKPKKEKTNV